MPYVDDDLEIMIETLEAGGNVLRDALAKIETYVAESATILRWDRAVRLPNSEEKKDKLVETGKALRDLAACWVKEEIDPELKSELEEAVDFWGEVQPLPEDVVGRTIEEGGPAYY
jgi:hypothetical protein